MRLIELLIIYNDGSYEMTNFDLSSNLQDELIVLIEKYKKKKNIDSLSRKG